MNEENLSNATFVVTVHEEKKAFQCNICNYSFYHKPNLNQFMREKIFQIQHLWLQFIKNRRLWEMIFVIKTFLTKPNLKRHIETVHEGKNCSYATFVVTIYEEKNGFQCNICHYSFSHKP